MEAKITEPGGNNKEEKNRKQSEIETELDGLNNFYFNNLLFNVKPTSKEQLKDLRDKLHLLSASFRSKVGAPMDENNKKSKHQNICSLWM